MTRQSTGAPWPEPAGPRSSQLPDRSAVSLGERRAAAGPPPGTLDGCAFCEIVAGPGLATIVREWPDALAIVPLNPVTDGHVLVIPREHVQDVTENPDLAAVVMLRAAVLAEAPCNIITSAGREATQSVWHLHVHVVPRREGDGLALPWSPVDPAAGRVLDAVQRWRNLGPVHFVDEVRAAKAELRAAVDAYDQLTGGGGKHPSSGPDNRTYPDSEGSSRSSEREPEPAPEPAGDGPGWEREAAAWEREAVKARRATVGLAAERDAARAELAEVTAERDERERERDHSDAALQRAAADMAQMTVERDRLERELATARRDAAADALWAAAEHYTNDQDRRKISLNELVHGLGQWAADIRKGARPVPGSPQPDPDGGEESDDA